jgi:Carbohydrate esterase 2 N-terminal/GDSL-like Lipase/Acylhydrolase family
MTTPALEPRFVAIGDPRIAVTGRTAGGHVRLVGYPGVTLTLNFTGPSLGLRAVSSSGNSRIGVVLDGSFVETVQIPKGTYGSAQRVNLLDGLEPGMHQVELVHQNETWQGVLAVTGVELAPEGELLAPPPNAGRKRLLFIGDSVTCGEALLRGPTCDKTFEWWDPFNSYGMRLGRLLRSDVSLVCFGGRGLIRDWQGRKDGLGGRELFGLAVPLETSPAEVFPGCELSAADLAWNHQHDVPDVIVVSLGTNDFNLALGPLPGREEYVSAYVDLVNELLQTAPKAEVVLTEGSIVNDVTDPKRPQKRVLRAYIEATLERVASPRVRFAPATYYPGDACDPHPTKEQHAHMADDLLPFVQQALGWR